MGMAGSPTPQRPPSASQGTPNHNMAQGQQSQHSTPQPAPQNQTPANQQQPNSAATPQTPTFPSNAQNPAVNGAPPAAAPLSPSSVTREQERMMVLLSINNELLYESIRMQQTLHEFKEDSGPPEAGAAPSREEMMAQQDYNQCMRRLQGNLSYLATMVDRDRKPATLPPSPAYLTPPPLNMKIPVKSHPPGADEETKALEPMVDREQRQKLMVELYTQLQGLYPGVDPKKEPTYNRAPGQKPGTAQASPVVTHSQGPPQTPTSATAP
ncbi:hypothetical protein BN1723_009086 [Verticillium longisporum]|uniref:Glutamine repeat protein-1 n=3 Tax=Verticillium TaxID=1036719 RepID=G2WQF9_VERDV|nr:uncharacterized protein VDAG_00601 [Verticillium dahliae VdLs.17]EGY13919.1 hypothetical protein VDAG_00601 [Verticillium dahliae VdLs.17]CRK09902.1 hypothetical protein BN1723_009086 [Verticillium longisporum]